MKPAVSAALLFIGHQSVHIELRPLGVVRSCRRVGAAAVPKELWVAEGLSLHLTLELSRAASFLSVMYHHFYDWVLLLGLWLMPPQLWDEVACDDPRLRAHDLHASELLAHDLVNRDHPFETLNVETLNLTKLSVIVKDYLEKPPEDLLLISRGEVP